MTGKGDTPEQKVNEAVKELNYHNMLVVIAVRDKTINNIGSIHTVAENGDYRTVLSRGPYWA